MSRTGAYILVMILRLGFSILAGLFHLWTMVIAYNRSGTLAAVISFFLPALSEVYWAITLIRINGQLLNPYTLVMIGLIILYVILLTVANIAEKMSGSEF